MPGSTPWPPLDETVERTIEEIVDAVDPVPDLFNVTEALEPIVEPIVDGIDDVLDKVDDVIPIPEPLDPRETWRKIDDAVDWIDEHFGPIADPIGDTLDPQPPVVDGPPEDDSGGWDVLDWGKFLLLLDWLSRQELAWKPEIETYVVAYDSRDFDKWRGSLQPLPDDRVGAGSVYTAPGPFAARLGDITMHGDPVAPGTGGANVLIGGRPALRLCDGHICTKATPAPHTPLGLRTAYTKVLVNGFPALRMGDFVDEGAAGPNPIVSGCASVTIGPTPPPVRIPPPGVAEVEPPSIIPLDWERIEYGYFKGTLALGVDLGGVFGRAKGKAAAARVFAEKTVGVSDLVVGDFDGDGRPLAFRTVEKRKTERLLGVGEIDIEVRRKKKFEPPTVKPQGNEEKEPEYVHYYEFVEVDPQ